MRVPKIFWELAGLGLGAGLIIWFFGKRPAYVIAGDPTITYKATPQSTPTTDQNNDGQQ